MNSSIRWSLKLWVSILFLTQLNLAVFPLGLQLASAEEDPTLSISHRNGTKTFKRSELLKRSDLEKITLEDIPTYPGKRIEYLAIPFYRFFEGISIGAESTIEFRCVDGFAGAIEPSRVLAHEKGKSVAYLAIEPKDHPWPIIHPEQGPATAGPFFLIWKNPELSKIDKEEWPYQIVSFEVQASIQKIFPKIFPPKSASKNARVQRGFGIFQRSCFSCHKINEQGYSDFGPDLNYPRNPTEYYSPSALRAFIRNPQSIRKWKNDRMLGFSPRDLSDSNLSDVIHYLEAMIETRPKTE